MLSQKAKYALRALLELARAGPGQALLISDIAERQRLPKKFLEQILLELKRRGVVQSKRGKNGGYALLKPPSMISFGEVIRIVDGPMAPLPCLSRTAYRRCDDCIDEARCAIRRVFAVTHAATAKVLDDTSLVDAIQGVALRAGARSRQRPTRGAIRRN
jgi:Rrf2 family protein